MMAEDKRVKIKQAVKELRAWMMKYEATVDRDGAFYIEGWKLTPYWDNDGGAYSATVNASALEKISSEDRDELE
jgi:hypothetical protein